MPCQQVVVIALYRRWCAKTKEDLLVITLVFGFCYYHVYDEVLADASHYGSESLRKLPVDSIIQHIEQDNCLISHRDLTVSLELDQQFFEPIKPIFIICNLRHKESTLNFFNQFHLFGGLSQSKFCHVFLILFLMKWKLLNVCDNFGKSC